MFRLHIEEACFMLVEGRAIVKKTHCFCCCCKQSSLQLCQCSYNYREDTHINTAAAVQASGWLRLHVARCTFHVSLSYLIAAATKCMKIIKIIISINCKRKYERLNAKKLCLLLHLLFECICVYVCAALLHAVMYAPEFYNFFFRPTTNHMSITNSVAVYCYGGVVCCWQ